MFTALAENFGNLREKINAFVALAPVINLGHSTAPFIRDIAKHRKASISKFMSMGYYELNGNSIDMI
jgi:lysosomal acid lipase/cholesteryl ester hydrolase